MIEHKALSLTECTDALVAIERPLVVMHVRPDGDTVGSGAALCKIFKSLGKRVYYTCPDPIPERLAFLTEGLDFTDSYEGLEPVSIDVPAPIQLGSLAEKLDFLLMIDHHAVSTPFAPHYTLPDASSAGEVLFGIAKELESRDKIKLTPDIAAPIYAAISSDTGGFAFSNATPAAYRAAASLIELGVDSADINRRLFGSKPMEQLRAEALTAMRLSRSPSGRIAYATITKIDRERESLPFSAFDTAIDVVRSLAGAEIAFIIKETASGDFKISLRSSGADVSKIAASHGGGGHIRAAACTISGMSAKEAELLLIKEAEALI